MTALTPILTSPSLINSTAWPTKLLSECYGKAIEHGEVDPTKTTLQIYANAIRNQLSNPATGKKFKNHVNRINAYLSAGNLPALRSIAPNHQGLLASLVQAGLPAAPWGGSSRTAIGLCYWKAVALNVVARTTTLGQFAATLNTTAKAASTGIGSITSLMNKVLNRANNSAALSLYKTGKANAFQISDVTVSSGRVTYSITDTTTGETHSVQRRSDTQVQHFWPEGDDLYGYPEQGEKADRGISKEASISEIVRCTRVAIRPTPAMVAAQQTANQRALAAQQATQNVLNKLHVDLTRSLIEQQAMQKAVSAAQIAALQKQVNDLKKQLDDLKKNVA